MKLELLDLLTDMISRKGSDLHLAVGQPPFVRVDGALTRMETESIDAPRMETLLLPHLDETQRDALMTRRQDIETSLQHPDLLLRLHVFWTRAGLSAALRPALTHVPTLEQQRLDPTVLSVLQSLIHLPRGLIIITGPSGSGKTTLAAGMLETLNQTQASRILILEEDDSYVFESKQSLITQRKIGEDVASFESGAFWAFHEDPDVVFFSELRSLETLHYALALAESGHLVIAQLHVENASEAVNRLIEAFPEPRGSIRRMLARNLVGVVAQKLLRPAHRPGREVAHEILRVTPRIRKMMLDGETDFRLAMEAGRDEGMQTMDEALLKLYREDKITRETVLLNLQDRDRLE